MPPATKAKVEKNGAPETTSSPTPPTVDQYADESLRRVKRFLRPEGPLAKLLTIAGKMKMIIDRVPVFMIEGGQVYHPNAKKGENFTEDEWALMSEKVKGLQYTITSKEFFPSIKGKFSGAGSAAEFVGLLNAVLSFALPLVYPPYHDPEGESGESVKRKALIRALKQFGWPGTGDRITPRLVIEFIATLIGQREELYMALNDSVAHGSFIQTKKGAYEIYLGEAALATVEPEGPFAFVGDE